MSSLTDAGIEDFFKVATEKKQEYNRDYKPELERRIRKWTEEKKMEGLDKLLQNIKVSSSSRSD